MLGAGALAPGANNARILNSTCSGSFNLVLSLHFYLSIKVFITLFVVQISSFAWEALSVVFPCIKVLASIKHL